MSDFNLDLLGEKIQSEFQKSYASTTMNTCLTKCVISYKEETLLPSEHRCLRNCYVKAFDFERMIDETLKFYVRNS